MGKMPPAVLKPQRAGLTLHSLPHEVILSIVEWTAVITIEEHLERQRLAHEAGHMHGDEDDEEEEEEEHDHDHDDGGFPVLGGFQFPPFGMGGFGPNGPNAGQGAAPQAAGGIGDVPFMQNLFGFLNNGAGAAPPPNNAAAAPAPPRE